VVLDVATPASHIVLQTAASGRERVTYGDEDVFVLVLIGGISADVNVSAGNHHLDTHMEKLPLPAAPVRALHNHATGHDMVGVLLERFGSLAYVGRDPLRWLQVPEGNLYGDLHRFPRLLST
jgi:hypothetical protein